MIIFFYEIHFWHFLKQRARVQDEEINRIFTYINRIKYIQIIITLKFAKDVPSSSLLLYQ